MVNNKIQLWTKPYKQINYVKRVLYYVSALLYRPLYQAWKTYPIDYSKACQLEAIQPLTKS